jgi:hypothetical protein
MTNERGWALLDVRALKSVDVAPKIIVLERGITPAGVLLECGTIEHRDPPAAVTQNATVLQLLGK